MMGRKQNIETLSDQSSQRVEPEVLIGMQTFIGITENHLTAIKHEKGELLEYILSPSNLSKHSDKYIFYTLRFDCSFAAANTIKPQLL